jgi:hypothetical protein
MPDQRVLGWVISVQGSNDPKPKLYAVVVEPKAHLSVADELGRAQALVGEHLSVTNERVEFQRRLTNGEIARLRLKPGEVKRFE